MTKEAQGAVQLILKNISEDESITPMGRYGALLNIENSISDMDEGLISKEEGVGLRIDSLKLVSKIFRE